MQILARINHHMILCVMHLPKLAYEPSSIIITQPNAIHYSKPKTQHTYNTTCIRLTLLSI